MDRHLREFVAGPCYDGVPDDPQRVLAEHLQPAPGEMTQEEVNML